MPFEFNFSFFSEDNQNEVAPYRSALTVVTMPESLETLSDHVVYIQHDVNNEGSYRYQFSHEGTIHTGTLSSSDFDISSLTLDDLNHQLQPQLLCLLHQRGHYALKTDDLFGWLSEDWQRALNRDAGMQDADAKLLCFEDYLKHHLIHLRYVLYRELEFLYQDSISTLLRYGYVKKRKEILSEYFELDESADLVIRGFRADKIPPHMDDTGNELIALSQVLGELADRLDKEKTDDAWFGERASVLASRLRQICQRLLTDAMRLLVDYRRAVLHSQQAMKQQLDVIIADFDATAQGHTEVAQGLTALEQSAQRLLQLHQQQKAQILADKAAQEAEVQTLKQSVETMRQEAIAQHQTLEAVTVAKDQLADTWWRSQQDSDAQQTQMLETFETFIQAERQCLQSIQTTLNTFSTQTREDILNTIYDLSKRRAAENNDECLASESQHASERMNHYNLFIDTMTSQLQACRHDIDTAKIRVEALTQRATDAPSSAITAMQTTLDDIDAQLNQAVAQNLQLRRHISTVQLSMARSLKRARTAAQAIAINTEAQATVMQTQSQTLQDTQAVLAETQTNHHQLGRSINKLGHLVEALDSTWAIDISILQPLITQQINRLKRFNDKDSLDKVQNIKRVWKDICETVNSQPGSFVSLAPLAEVLAQERHVIGRTLQFFGHKARSLSVIEQTVKALTGQEQGSSLERVMVKTTITASRYSVGR